jgi:negative regulator of sigma E activity
MSSNHHSTDDRHMQEREILCALFDGELQGDEARFALKRLGHDVQWREAVGRWQLYGDVLRGHATTVAAGGFAERVSMAIAEESVSPQVAPVKVAAHRRGWIGGALAASVAVVALFITRPFTDDPVPSPARDVAATQVASTGATAATAPVRPSAPVQLPSAPTRPASDQAALALGAAAVAVAEVPRRAVDRRTSRSQSQRAAMRNSRQSQLPSAIAASSAAASVAIAASAQTARTEVAPLVNPFRPEHAEAAVRPWPRAVLPQYSAGSGAMTASFGGGTASPSFYPFEPTQGPQVDQGQSDGSDTPR